MNDISIRLRGTAQTLLSSTFLVQPRHTLTVAAIVLAAVSGSADALAQDGQQLAAIEEVLVTSTPIRDSQAAALAQKREADNVVDIIAADTIGRFPDQNLADSLGRIPGLAIERDQGQARFINFRGAPFRYTSIAFDGIDVPGAENGRIPRFDSFPSVITSSIEVNKAITPDMPGEAVAGFINMNTFSPSDAAGLRVSLEGGYGNQELGDVGIEKYNGRVSYSNEGFGILGFYSFNKRGRITDNREYELRIDPATDQLIVDNLDFRSYRGERRDEAYGGTLEFRPADKVDVSLRTLYSEFVDLEERNQFDFDFTDGANITGTPIQPVSGYQPLVLVTRLLEDGKYTNSTWTNTLDVEVSGGNWDYGFVLNYTETENITDLPIPLSAGGTIAASYDVSDIRDPVVNVFAPFTMTPTDINTLNYAANLSAVFAGRLDIESWKVKADAERETSLFGGTTFKGGVQLDLREAAGQNTGFVTSSIPAGIDINSFVTDELWDTGFTNSINGRNVDNVGLQAAIEAAGGIPVTFDPAQDSNIDENIYAAYAMGTTEFEWGNVVYGVRVEYTDFKTTGNQVTGGLLTPVAFDDTYVNVLPSVHINVDVTDDVKFRVSGTTGVSRPTYTELRASARVDIINNEIDGGNPFLKAEKAYGLDTALEWYFDDASILSVGAYYRSIDNVIYADSSQVPDGSVFAPGVFAAGTPVNLNSFFNGEDGELLGLELNLIAQATFLPYPFDGFGFAGNLTLLDSEFAAPTRPQGKFDLPGTSDVIYNASLYYENFGLSVRLNYQYRDDWLSTTENDSLSEFWAEEERLDLSIRYALPLDVEGVAFTLFANANNLTDAKDLRYVNSERTPNQYEGFGERYLVGLRIDY